jgi:hypothetical protein
VSALRSPAALLPLALGVLAVAVGTLAGWNAALEGLLLSPPLPVRILLGSLALVVGVGLVVRSADRLGTSQQPRELIRAVRLVFLAVGFLAAAAGWFIGSPVPIVAGLVICGIDVIETSVLLLVTAARNEDGEGA